MVVNSIEHQASRDQLRFDRRFSGRKQARADTSEPLLLYVGLTCQGVPLAIRERVSIDSREARTMLLPLGALASGRMILSTCERFELYAFTDAAGIDSCTRALCDRFDLPVTSLMDHARIKTGNNAARHLLRVAAGLESRVVGESQVLRQVRDAYALAMSKRSLDPILAAVGRAAIHTGKRVRAETSINRDNRSIASIAVGRAERSVRRGSLPNLVVVGSGRLAGDIASEIVRARFGSVAFVARNAQRAYAMAGRIGASGYSLDLVGARIADADAVIVCTSSPTYVIDASVVDWDRDRSLDVIDLAVPGNVDPAVGRAKAITLCHLDTLLSKRRDEHAEGFLAAEKIIAEELARFDRWRRSREVAPTIAAWTSYQPELPDGRSRDAKRRLHRRIMRLKDSVAA